jgi:hypothetical protein
MKKKRRRRRRRRRLNVLLHLFLILHYCEHN